MILRVNIADAKANLSKLIDCALAGEEVIIARYGVPLARLAPVTALSPRPLGFMAHCGPIPTDAFDPDPEDWAGDDKPL